MLAARSPASLGVGAPSCPGTGVSSYSCPGMGVPAWLPARCLSCFLSSLAVLLLHSLLLPRGMQGPLSWRWLRQPRMEHT